LRDQFGLTIKRDHAALIGVFNGQCRAEPLQHAFGVVTRGFFFDYDCLARRVQPGQQNR
jgi:hypothetical protein